MKRLLEKRRPIWIILGAGLLVVAGVLVVAAFINPQSAGPGPQQTETLSATATSLAPTAPAETSAPETSGLEASPTPGSIAASVNGYTITQSYLSQTVKLNTVLGRLSGASVLDERETLQRLIRSQLIVQGATAFDEPTDEDVEGLIASLLQNWGVSEERLVQELEAVDLERAFLEDTIKRLLTVEAAVGSLESEGNNLGAWLREQEEDAEIMVFADLIEAEEEEASPTAESEDEDESPLPTPEAQSQVPDVAPNFTLDRAGGGTLTLNDQLKEGPVVLVFFERCG